MRKAVPIKLSLWITVPLLIAVLLAMPTWRKQEQNAAAFGETIARYVVERDREADKRERVMIVLTTVSVVVAIVAAIAAVLPIA